jgi:cell division protein FtsI (penicillin-binding protein 3)
MSPNAIRGVKIRLGLVALGFAFALGAVFLRALRLQVEDRAPLQRIAREQQNTELTLPPKRGAIYDRRGVPLAVSVEVDSAYADPALLEAPRRAAGELARALDLDARKVLKSLDPDRHFVWLKRQLAPAEVDRVKALGLTGVGFVKEARRFYPQRELASNVVGLAGRDGDGLEGVEMAFDWMLRGRPRTLASLRDARGRPLLEEGAIRSDEVEGASVTLTLDRSIQFIAENALRAGLQETGARAGMVVALDPGTGEILALANQPTFNPNAPAADAELRRDRAVVDTYEPGSTFKVFLIATALDQKLLGPSDTFFCENGSYTVGTHTIHDHLAHGWLTPAQIVQFSSNIGAAKIAQKIGAVRLRDGLVAFGFGEKTGCGLPGEAKGKVPLPKRDIELATMAFGQGVTASPLQVTAAFAAIANGGQLMRPYFVQRIVEPTGQVVLRSSPQPIRRVVSAGVAKMMVAMMAKVFEPGGTAAVARPTGYPAAGKTGTAQKVDPITGTYATDRSFASFVGFAPADSPRLVVGVFLDEPKGDGGHAAAPVFKAIIESALPQMGVTGISSSKNPSRPAPAVVASSAKASTLAEDDPSETAAVSETTNDPEPSASAAQVRVPDVRGMPARMAVRALSRAHLEPAVQGSGRVFSQAPLPGSAVPSGAAVRLELTAAD